MQTTSVTKFTKLALKTPLKHLKDISYKFSTNMVLVLAINFRRRTDVNIIFVIENIR